MGLPRSLAILLLCNYETNAEFVFQFQVFSSVNQYSSTGGGAVVWCSVVRCGVAWYRVVWYGAVWSACGSFEVSVQEHMNSKVRFRDVCSMYVYVRTVCVHM